MKFNFVPMGCVPAEKEQVHIAHSRSLGLPKVCEKERPPLAVVGGGFSINQWIDRLRNWPGDIWANGSAFQWCRKNGIKATFFCIDPHPDTVNFCGGAEHAIVSSCVNPLLLEALKQAKIEVFDLVHEGEMSNHGVTGVTATPELAIRMGYRDVTYFGCDSSYPEGRTHAYHNETTEHTIRVSCNGESFVTNPAYLLQAEYLANMIRLCSIFKEHSGGLLRAMVNDLEYDITHGTKGLHDLLRTA